MSADDHIGRGLVRNELDVDLGERAEQLGAEVLRAADGNGAHVELARLRARRLEQVGHASCRANPRWSRTPARNCRARRSGRDPSPGRTETACRSPDADRGAVGDETERVAVGRGGDHRARGGDAAGTRHVLDHEALAELLAELVGGEPRGHVGDAAGPERQDHPHRPAGIGLRARHMRHAERRGSGQRRTRERPARDPGLPGHRRLLTNSLQFERSKRTQLAFLTLRPSRCATTWSTCIDVDILVVHVEQVDLVREQAAVEAALLHQHHLVAVRIGVDRGRAHAARGALAAHDQRLDAELRQMRGQRRAEEHAGALLGDDDVAGLRLELRPDRHSRWD